MIAERAGGDGSTGGDADVTQTPQPRVKMNPEGGSVINSDKPAPDSRHRSLDAQSVGVVQTRQKAMAKLNDREMTRGVESSASDDGSRVADGGATPQTGERQDPTHDIFTDMARIDISDNVTPDRQETGIDCSSTDFRQAQRDDKSLEAYWTRAKAGSNEFKIIHGLLYKRMDDTVDSTESTRWSYPRNFENSYWF